jgi:hypothetical protein
MALMSCFQSINTFNQSATKKIDNIVGWSWQGIPDALEKYWPSFECESKEDTHFKIILDDTRLLWHSMTSLCNFAKIMKTAKDRDVGMSVEMLSRESLTQYVHPGLVYCTVKLTEDEIDSIPTKPRIYALENRYGSVNLSFPIKPFLSQFESGVQIGTRKYVYEQLQTLNGIGVMRPRQLLC